MTEDAAMAEAAGAQPPPAAAAAAAAARPPPAASDDTTATHPAAAAGGRGAEASAPPRRKPGRPRSDKNCQVCGTSVDALKPYYQRYRICEVHVSQPLIEVDGRPARFCQQCGRLHDLAAFDGALRSCRAKLDKHSQRRRRRLQGGGPPGGSFSAVGAARSHPGWGASPASSPERAVSAPLLEPAAGGGVDVRVGAAPPPAAAHAPPPPAAGGLARGAGVPRGERPSAFSAYVAPSPAQQPPQQLAAAMTSEQLAMLASSLPAHMAEQVLAALRAGLT